MDIEDVLAENGLAPCVMCGAPCRVEPGHIYVGLDFIPVAERLPEDRKLVRVLRNSGQYPADARYMGDVARSDDGWLRRVGWFLPPSHLYSGPRPIDNVTHWAEIPPIGGG